MNKISKRKIIINSLPKVITPPATIQLKEFKKLSGRINCGLGHMIFCKAQLDSVKDQYEEIKLAPDLKWLRISRQEAYDDQHKFIFKFMKLLFDKPPYIISDDQNLPVKYGVPFMRDDGIMPVVPDLVKYLCRGKPLPTKQKYIVLTTKVRGVDIIQTFQRNQDEFFSILQQLARKYRLIILGDRIIWPNLLKYTCIYTDYIKNLKKYNLTDLSMDDRRISSPDLKMIQHDCMIMNGAEAVVTFGNGGNFSLAIASSKILDYKNDGGQMEPVETYMFGEHYDKDGKFVTRNYKKFLGKLASL